MATPVQLTGTPGESSGICIGTKRTNSGGGYGNDAVILYAPKKRQKIEGTPELYELYTVIDNIDFKKEPSPVKNDKPCENDLRFMKKAYAISEKSPDESTKVGAIIVDPKTDKIIGEGWNRMPAGCEERFGWGKGHKILDTKYPYVLHGVRAAIIDALIKKHDLKGTTLYATLIPDHIDSQFIREVGITKVVFVEDKFSKFAFTIASKRILNGLEWRKIQMPDEKEEKLAAEADSEKSD